MQTSEVFENNLVVTADTVHWTLLKAGTQPQRPPAASEAGAAAPVPAQLQPPPMPSAAPEPWGAPAPECPYMGDTGQDVHAMADAPPGSPRWTRVQLLQPMEAGSSAEAAGPLFSQLLFPSSADLYARAGSALAAPLPVQDKPQWPAPGSGGPQPARDAGQAPIQMHALAMAAAAASQAGGGAAVQAEPARPAAAQAGNRASGFASAGHAAAPSDGGQGLPGAAVTERGAAGDPMSPLRRLAPRSRRRTRASRGRSKQGTVDAPGDAHGSDSA